jgi:tRNA-2-methylthio-N6-dimethylallyladenosine synthase
MEPKIPEAVKSDRLSKLIALQNTITYSRTNALIGTIQEVLVIGKSRDGNLWNGRTRQNKTVVFDGPVSVGEFVKVKIDNIRGLTTHGWTPYGRLITT